MVNVSKVETYQPSLYDISRLKYCPMCVQFVTSYKIT